MIPECSTWGLSCLVDSDVIITDVLRHHDAMDLCHRFLGVSSLMKSGPMQYLRFKSFIGYHTFLQLIAQFYIKNCENIIIVQSCNFYYQCQYIVHRCFS